MDHVIAKTEGSALNPARVVLGKKGKRFTYTIENAVQIADFVKTSKNVYPYALVLEAYAGHHGGTCGIVSFRSTLDAAMKEFNHWAPIFKGVGDVHLVKVEGA